MQQRTDLMTEIKGLKMTDLPNLPAKSIIVWQQGKDSWYTYRSPAYSSCGASDISVLKQNYPGLTYRVFVVNEEVGNVKKSLLQNMEFVPLAQPIIMPETMAYLY